jgi:putative acetyltransferase
VTIRPEWPADEGAIRVVVSAAFGSDAEAQLVDRIRASPEYLPELALVALVDGKVVGHVMGSYAVVLNDAGGRRICMLSPLAVLPDRHKRGIGGGLVRALLAAADARGEPAMILEGDPAYYGRFGFVPAQGYGIEMPIPDWAPPEAAQIMPLSSFDPDDPTLRGTVVYPAAFDGLE